MALKKAKSETIPGKLATKNVAKRASDNVMSKLKGAELWLKKLWLAKLSRMLRVKSTPFMGPKGVSICLGKGLCDGTKTKSSPSFDL